MKSSMEASNESNPPGPSFSSLPDDVVVSILAHISSSYYPTLSLVSKSFRLLIRSKELDMARLHLGTREECVYVCLQSPAHLCDQRWFSLWVKPDDHQTLNHCTIDVEDKKTENLLLPIPSSFSHDLPTFYSTVGLETYKIRQNLPSFSTDVWVQNKMVGKWCKAPSMLAARNNPLEVALEGKIYVMGGCGTNGSPCWAEVFDPKTQTWEPLPDPGPELRFSPIKKLQADAGKVYVRTTKKNFVYVIEESKWEVVEENLGESQCQIENVWYCYFNYKFLWYDTEWGGWRTVRGLCELDQHLRMETEIVDFGGKLAIFWTREVYPATETKKIWCTVVSLKKQDDGEVWGQIEWEDVVLKVPQSYAFLHCTHSLQ